MYLESLYKYLISQDPDYQSPDDTKPGNNNHHYSGNTNNKRLAFPYLDEIAVHIRHPEWKFVYQGILNS